MKDVNLVMLWFVIIFLLSVIIMFFGALSVWEDNKKRIKLITYNALLFSLTFIISLILIIAIGLISITKEFKFLFPFILFGVCYLYMYFYGGSKYKEKFG